jgi:hypothetical protein
MKKAVFGFVVILVLGFVVLGCELNPDSTTGNGDNQPTKFEGVWASPSVNVSDETPNYVSVEMIFTANTFIFKMFEEGSVTSLKGTFTYTEPDCIHFITTHRSTDNGSTWMPVSSTEQNQPPLQTYSFSNGNLILDEYTFTKQL